MAFWDKVKSLKNQITGGGAKVTVSFPEELELGTPFPVTITAVVSDADINIKGVYLKVLAEERIKAEGEEVEYEHGHEEVEREVVRITAKTFADKLEVSGEQTLEANQTYTWTAELDFPEDLNGTYRGVYAIHEYAMFAGLDAPGNDPDSGWVRFEIY